MALIKRYPNRKLYDTEAKKYITLDGIAALIREGEEVQVVDHTTGEDLTALTLSQIIFEQEKKGGGFLPKSVLTSLVQAGGDTVNTLRRGLTAPLDLFRQVDDEIDKRLQSLINRGELAKEEGLRLRRKLLNREPDADEEIERVLTAHGVPRKEEIQKLNEQIETLSAKLESLLADKSSES
ncbi:MAG: polyhydroxyalkanoate synthesis regulator DNA-binding domain-containing protein [Ardenticatenaceae bacterium]|nr:polyhydroxyalkanoate synthesis regulator DNA-binding domain-containing protein [Ardenticatenaceae bacterium]MCB9443829.1 polyhydroxyalkanoate synthesis regulator DNA-binding domain-containing protein [Ardenticatenaceae bacterium]